MNLGLGQIEVGLVGVVEVGDVLVGNADAGSGFLVEQLLDAEIAAELRLQILDRHLALVELLLKLFLRVGRFELGELRVHVRIGGHQAPLLGALQHDFVIDERAQDLQALDGHLVVAGMLGLAELGILILLVEFGEGDGASVYRGRHAGRRGAIARG